MILLLIRLKNFQNVFENFIFCSLRFNRLNNKTYSIKNVYKLKRLAIYVILNLRQHYFYDIKKNNKDNYLHLNRQLIDMQASSQIADSSNNNIDLKTEDVDVLKVIWRLFKILSYPVDSKQIFIGY